jgi:transcriptional regulator
VYVPPHFQETRPGAVAALIEAAPLACVVAQTAEGLVANHLPLLAAPDGALIGHVALANEMHRVVAEGQEVLAIFRGPDAYVSPNWYPSKAETHRAVPTWNYTVAHLSGTISFQHDDHAKRAAVALLTRAHERRTNGANAWRMADAPADYMTTMLSNIVAFRITVTRVLANAKLSQNREARDFAGVVEGLRAAGQEGVAGEMEGVRGAEIPSRT